MNRKLMRQMEDAERRYHAHEGKRNDRKEHLEKLGQGGDWRKVDDPARILRRLNSLGMQEVASEAMASIEAAVTQPVSKGITSPPAPALNVLERIIGANNLLNSQFLIKGAAIARTVARIVIRTPQRRVVGYGTGFMISPQLMMTNNHVLESALEAQESIAQFYYYETLAGEPVQGASFRFEPQVFFQTDTHLDFTIVAVQAVNANRDAVRDIGWNHLIPESGKTIVGESVNILQHPGGNRQQVALRQNNITDLLDDFLHYSADTDRGSSGGPVCNDQWEIAALHHAGVPRRDASRRVLLKSGVPWDGSDQTEDQIDWIANEGTRISRIVTHLRDRINGFNSIQRELFEQAFLPAPFDPTLKLICEHVGSEFDPVNPGGGPRVDSNGQVTWTVPIEIRIGLGGLGGGFSPVPPLSDSGADIVNVPDPTADLNIEIPEDSADFQSAMSKLRESKNRPYFNADQDKLISDAYYQDIDDSLTSGRLYNRLNELVTESHHTILSYKKARLEHLYPWIDLHEDDSGERSLLSIYSGKGFTPEEIIEQEIEIEAQRERKIQEMMMTESSLDESRLEEMLEFLEETSPFNCEHVVPQSWFQKKKPMVSDLHHLFTCEWGCNSFRSNIPYFDFPPEAEAVRDDCGERDTEKSKFEPSAGKGAVARATLYFLLRYPFMIGDEARELQRDRLPILVKWHNAEPVTDYERHRNAAIFEVQGNRNPFIDHPEWVDKVNFEKGFGFS